MYNSTEKEQQILKYWQDNNIFEKSVNERPENKPYVFYDGPPFATGLPHYGHILGSVIKDVVARYWTMKGYRVRRRWGWDCHGLPIENIVEKELGVSGKKQIETTIGVEKFNETCRSKVNIYTQEWKKMVDHIGRWVEFDNSYKTMDSTYMESVWWALKTIWDKGLIYEGRKVLMYCPRCETPVSKAEIAMDNSYKDITEETTTIKFKIKEQKAKSKKHTGVDGDVFILAWTTTPWTLPGNVALAVGNNIQYVVIKWTNEKQQEEHLILAKDRLDAIMKNNKYEIIKELLGSELVGLEYEPLFDISGVKNSGKKAWYVTDADFVTTVDGTGVVHTAVIYGEEDYNLGVKIDLPMIPLLNEQGNFNDEAPEFIRGQYFKKAEKEIKRNLDERGLIFNKEQFTHSYPHCWRCGTQLFYNAISAWFIDIQKIKNKLIEHNKKINWYPEHLKEGRFLNILETAPDWNISRNRYWATPLPFWKCQNKMHDTHNTTQNNCNNVVCIGSIKELKEKAINFDEIFKSDKVDELDLHKHIVDKIKLKCDKCAGVMERIPEVIDCWVESASMPFAEFHYPFENQKTFEERFPGQYIAEYIAQTRAWFYYMHAMAVLLFDNISFENVVCTGTILNDKGEKLSKSKMNYTDPWVIIEQYGADTLRYYLMTSVVMQGENLFFNDREVKDSYNKVMNILWNVVTFYEMYEDKSKVTSQKSKVTNVLDIWILSKLNLLIKEITENLDKYDTVKAGRPIKDFIDDLSTWYLRRSRDRFKEENEEDKQNALATLKQVLLTLSKVMAPFTPFIAEEIYLKIANSKEQRASVHLEEWPQADEKLINQEVLNQMDKTRELVEKVLFARNVTKIKVKQPLAELKLAKKYWLAEEYLEILKDETNIKKIVLVENNEIKEENNWFVIKNINNSEESQPENIEVIGSLNTEITEELKKEGLVREIVRAINQIRKEQKLTVEDKVTVEYETEDELLKSAFTDFEDELKKSVLAISIVSRNGENEQEIDGRKVKLSVQKEIN